MRIIGFLMLACFFFLSCSNPSESGIKDQVADTLNDVETESPAAYTSWFPELFTYLQSQDSNFSPSRFEGGEMETSDVPEFDLDQALEKKYRPYFIFNSDSSLAIDLVMYNYVLTERNGKTFLEEGGPDFDAGLIDYKKRTRRQILFFGTMGSLLKAKWENDHTVLMAGIMEMEGDSVRPALWRYDLRQKKREVYRYPELVRADISDFREKLIANSH